MVAVPTPSPRRNKTPAPAMPQALPLSKPNRNTAAAEMFSSFEDPEAFLGFGEAPAVLPSFGSQGGSALVGNQILGNMRISQDQQEITEDRQRQAGELASGIGAGVTADILGLPADILALVFRDAPKFAAAVTTGKKFDEMPRSSVDEALTALQKYAGGDAFVKYGATLLNSIGATDVDTEKLLASPAFQSGRIASSVIDPAVLASGVGKFADILRGSRSEVLGPERVEPTIDIPRTQLESPVIEGEAVEVAPGTSALEPGIAGLLPDQSRVADDVVDTVTAQRSAFDDILAPDEQFVEVENLAPQRVNYGHYPDNALIEALEEAQDGMDTVAVSLIRNEMAGRRQGIFQEDTLENLRTQFADEIDDPIAPVREELPALDITDAQGNRVEEDGFLSVEAGIGALDESNPVFNSTGLIIGATPNNYFARVKHYSPTMGALTKYVSSPKFARAADKNGRLAGAQWLSIIKNFRSGSPEVSGTGFESALLADPKKKFNAAEVRRLVAEKVPQTRVRTYLQSTSSDELDSIGEFNRVSHFRQQYYPEITGGVDNAGQDVGLTTVPEARIDFGVSLFGNTVPEINLPGLGKVTPKSINDHGYSWFPGYYGHSRFADFNVESVGSGASKVMNPRVRFIGEIQSNDVSNQSSGQAFRVRIPPVNETKYFRTVDEYVEGYNTFGETIRPTYTEEWDKLLRLDQDLRGEKLVNHSKLERQIEDQENVLELAMEKANDVGNARYSKPDHLFGQPAATVPALVKLLSTKRGTSELLSFAQKFDRTQGSPTQFEDRTALEPQIETLIELAGGVADPVSVAAFRSTFVDLSGSSRSFDPTLDQQPQLMKVITDKITRTYLQQLDARGSLGLISDPKMKSVLNNLSPEEIQVLKIPYTETLRMSDSERAVRDELLASIADQFTDEDIIRVISTNKKLGQDLTEELNTDALILSEEDAERFLDTKNINTGELFLDSYSSGSSSGRKDWLESSLKDFFADFGGGSDLDVYLNQLEVIKVKNNIEELSKDLVPDDELADEIDAYRIAFRAHPAKDKITVAKRLADLSIESNGAKGYAPKTPYSDDGSYHEFSVRSAIREAIDDNNIDFVVFADPLYLANAPGRTPNDAFLRNYGPAVDKGLKEFGKANPEARAELYNVPGAALDDPNTIKFYGPSKIGSRAVHRGELKELPLRVLDVRKPAVKELMERPIRRAAGGMVRSGIGSMAKEVM